MTREELEVIHKQIKNGQNAEIALDVLDAVLNEIVEESKNEFANLPLAYYQNIDNNKIYVLLSRINIARDIGLKIRMKIDEGERAKSILINGEQ